MKKFVVQIFILIVVIFVALYFGILGPGSRNFPLVNRPPAQTQQKNVAVINGVKINIEIADTPEKRSKGLGGRQFLASDSGMLFVFPKDDKYRFWMKGLSFPLDLIWFNDKKIVDIMKNVPPPASGQEDKDLPIYIPNEPADMVLEVNGGFSDAFGIKIGDIIEIQ